MHTLDWRKYALAFLITAAIFATAFFVSNYFNEKRAEEIRTIEENISIDILSLETQFDLLEQLSCKDIQANTVLSQELSSLASRLNYTENQLGADNPEVDRLKRSYTLLLSKDYLLMKRIAQKCDIQPIFILYFYSNEGDCEHCTRQGYVLTDLQETYPRLRVYAFDYHLDLSVMSTLRSIYDLTGELPALVINDEVYYGYHDQEAIEDIVPEIRELATTTAATSTQASPTTTSPQE